MDIFKNLKTVVKRREVVVDNEVFQLHYRVTALMLIGCAALVASKQHFGDPIDCITKDDVPNKIMDTYCWIHATFTLPDACNKTVGVEVAHPCVDKFVHPREERVYHKYYQWVYFVLFFQAMCFYAPHFFWKMWESRLLITLTQNLRNPLCKDKEQKEEIANIVGYLTKNRDMARHRKRHRTYLYYFLTCELMNFLNVIMQIYLVDEFLGGTFTTYGLDVLNYVQLDQEIRVDPMVRIFPRMTKCSFHRFGASGDVQKYDALCILPLNIINEKIYIVMWFWFLFLALVTGVWLIIRCLMLTQPTMRYKYLNRQASLTNGAHIRYVLKRLDIGDWFLLSMICKNMDSQWFRLLMIGLAERLHELEKKSRNGRIEFPAHRRKKINEETLVDNEESVVDSADDDDENDDDENDDSDDSLDSEPSVVIDPGNGAALKSVAAIGKN